MSPLSETEMDTAINLVSRMSPDQYSQFVRAINAIKKADRQAQASRVRATLKKHDRVRIMGPTKPQYLAGETGEVIEFRSTRITVKLDCGPIGKFRTGTVVCPPQMLEKIS